MASASRKLSARCSPSASAVFCRGSGLAVRIPAKAVHRMRLKPGSKVIVEIGHGSFTVRRVDSRKKWTEAELLQGVTPDMVGGEIW